MAKKDYSAGGGKKWLVAIGLVVLVAIIVVVILLCIPPNTYNAVQTLNRATQTKLFSNSIDKENFADLQKKVGSTESAIKLNYYNEELSDILIMTETMNDVLEFYNDNLIFAQSNKNLKKNYKPIKNNLNDAKKSQDRLTSMLRSDVEKAAGTDALKNAVIDFRREYITWLTCNQKAIVALNSAYVGSMGNVIINNTGSKIVLNTVNQFISVIINDYKALDGVDKKGSSRDSYSYDFHNEINCFNLFVRTKLNDSSNSEIYQYYFNASYMDRCEKLNKFSSLYNEANFKSVMTSVTYNSGVYNFSYSKPDVDDSEGVLDAVKAFLGGR